MFAIIIIFIFTNLDRRIQQWKDLRNMCCILNHPAISPAVLTAANLVLKYKTKV